MKIHARKLHKTSLVIHIGATILGTLTMVGLACYSVISNHTPFDASGFGMGLGAIIGGSGIGAFGISTVGAMMPPMAQGGSGAGQIEGG